MVEPFDTHSHPAAGALPHVQYLTDVWQRGRAERLEYCAVSDLQAERLVQLKNEQPYPYLSTDKHSMLDAEGEMFSTSFLDFPIDKSLH